MTDTLKLAGVQMDVALGDVATNLVRMSDYLRQTASNGSNLTVFPECALTGYCFDSLDEARPHAETIPGPSTHAMVELCKQLNTAVAFGMLESCDDAMFNACALIDPSGLVASYRKVHLPYLGIDRFTTPGDRGFGVYPVAGAQVGLNICYDSAFPESARVMALAGAEIILLPTNFPPGAECMAEYVVNARAMENAVFYACVNRVGTERGFRFIGKSKICDTNGAILAQAPDSDEAIIYADLDLERARRKHIIRVPDQHEIHRFADRRPDVYSAVTAPKQHTWTNDPRQRKGDGGHFRRK